MTGNRTLLAIATTGGPSVVRAMTFSQELPRSQIYIHNAAHKPVGVNSVFHDFDQFLRPALRRHGLKIPDGTLQLWVDQAIDKGDSWHLGLAAAYILYATKRLDLEDAAPGRLVVTGTLGTNDWNAYPVEHIPKKLRETREFLDEATETPGQFLAPRGNVETAGSPADGVQPTAIADLAQLIEVLSPEHRRPLPIPTSETASQPAKSWRGLMLGTVIAAAGLGGVYASGALDPKPSRDDDEAGRQEQTKVVQKKIEPASSDQDVVQDESEPPTPRPLTRNDLQIEALFERAGVDCAMFRLSGDDDFGARPMPLSWQAVDPNDASIVGGFQRGICGLKVTLAPDRVAEGATLTLDSDAAERSVTISAEATQAEVKLDPRRTPPELTISIKVTASGTPDADFLINLKPQG